MLIGTWKNVEDLEEALTLAELQLVINALREQELRNQKFFAAINGIDLDKAAAKDAEEKFMQVKQRVDARLAGMDEEKFELNSLGFDVLDDDEEEE